MVASSRALAAAPPEKPRTALLPDGPPSMHEAPGIHDRDQLIVLRAKEPALLGTRIPLEGEVVIGRHAESSVPLPFDDAVSGKHARLVRRDGGWILTDEGSRNGSFLNGKRLTEPTKLVNGASIQIGHTTFTFVGAAPASPAAKLPFPVAISATLIAHQAGPFAHVKALLDGIETSLRFIVAAELAAVRDVAPRGSPLLEKLAAELAQIGVRQLGSMSMGQWEGLAMRLARLATEAGDPRVAEVARALINRRGERSALGEKVREAVAFRNKQIGHGKILNEEAFRDDVARLDATFNELVGAVSPLSEYRLVSVADLEFRGSRVAYTFYLHQGPLDIFPTFREDVAARLEKTWCYLLRGAADAPLSLSPIVAVDVSGASRRLEVFLADGIVLGPEHAKVAARGVTSNATASLEVLWGEEIAELYATVTAAR